jgi:DNA-binding transcriptional LysR family regulator
MLDNLRADLNAVRVFARVVEAGSFRAAARTLGMPKSTVSLRVAELENRLGERLLERTTRRLRLTDAGRTYHERAVAALETLADAERTLSEHKAVPTGRLRVTTTVEGGQFLFAPIFAEYLRRYPHVELQVVLADRHVDLIEEGIDLALRGGPLPDSSFVARRLSLLAAIRVYASPAYLKARGVPRRPRELEQHDCLVMTSQSNASVWSFQVGGKVVAVKVRPRAEANSFVVVREFARAGLGVARMPENIAQPAVDSGQLRPLLDAFAPRSAGPLHAIYPSARHLSAKMRGMLDLLDEFAAARR